jgi:N-acetylglucosaminyl-diphospho-decaprenol L-rhamnosyltransferase
VVVLDNASGDGTAEMVAADFPEVRLLALDENLGFAAGVNRAADAATGEFLLLLNPDTVVHQGALDELVGFARANPRHGLYGGRTLDPDGTVNPGSCWDQPSLWSLTCFATMLSTAFKGSRLFDPEAIGGWKRDSVREVGIVTGCLLLAPAAVWRELGGFDTRFFMYGEDADLGARAWAAGYRPVVTPDAVITHEIGVSSASRPDKLVLLFRGKATLLRKHWPPLRRKVGLGLLLAGVGIRALLARKGPWPAVWTARSSWIGGYEPVTRAPAVEVEAGAAS